jgi:hypothetical protein
MNGVIEDMPTFHVIILVLIIVNGGKLNKILSENSE